jgi:chromosome segregation ATPase
MYEDAEHYFNRLVDEKGFLNLTPLEELAVELMADMATELASANEEARDWEMRSDEYESEAMSLRDECAVLEDDLREAQEENGGNDETTQDDEVEFLKTLIADLENELAAIDNGAVA